jgi:hypothetical protein
MASKQVIVTIDDGSFLAQAIGVLQDLDAVQVVVGHRTRGRRR